MSYKERERRRQRGKVKDENLWSRREVLLGAGTVAALGVGTYTRRFFSDKKVGVYTEGEQPQEKLFDYLELLPDSLVTRELQKTANLYFAGTFPKKVEYFGVEVPIYYSSLIAGIRNLPGGTGVSTFRLLDSEKDKKHVLYPVQDSMVLIPSVLPITRRDIEATFPKDKLFIEGLAPLISISMPEERVIRSDYKGIYSAFEKYVYIKELATILIVDIWLEETLRNMRLRNMPTSFYSRGVDGKVRQGQFVVQTLALVNERKDVNKTIDLAGHFLALEATKGLETRDVLVNDCEFLKYTGGGLNSRQEIFYKSMAAAYEIVNRELFEEVTVDCNRFVQEGLKNEK